MKPINPINLSTGGFSIDSAIEHRTSKEGGRRKKEGGRRKKEGGRRKRRITWSFNCKSSLSPN
ncbi:hypothetical protein, partial [Tychonema sp. LEGE 07196]|nr:hypothetical protein [Tychonema sp. LEGE 07196]